MANEQMTNEQMSESANQRIGKSAHAQVVRAWWAGDGASAFIVETSPG